MLNTGIVQLFLGQPPAARPAGTRVVLVWDGAGDHVGKGLRVPADITPVTPPPYSPELNPVERLWLYLRHHPWADRVYPDLAAVEAAAVAGWRAVGLRPEVIKTVCRCE